MTNCNFKLEDIEKEVQNAISSLDEPYSDPSLIPSFLITSKIADDFKSHENNEISTEISNKEKKIIGIAPFASFNGKTYPLDLIQNVIAYLQKDHTIYLLGGGDELKQIEVWDKAYDNVIDISKNFNQFRRYKVIRL